MIWFLIAFVSSLLGAEFPSLVQTSHILSLPEVSFTYTAITGQFPIELTDPETAPSEIFFIAYLKDGEENRPITFIFPGGPGGSCGPQAICTFGPRRLPTPAEGKSLLPPYNLIDNPQTLLPWTDLVFVDPVGTGFSYLGEDKENFSSFFSVDGDIIALGDFVYNFIAYFNRWNSPKYLSGASYGTARCCGLAEYLSFHDFSVHGIILLGAALDYSTLIGQQSRALPSALLIPTLAATAWYHGRLWPEQELDEVVDFARRFVFDHYIPAMMQPSRLSKPEQDIFYKELSELIGLPIDTVRRYQGRFDEALYSTEFFASERKILGRLDTRFIGDISTSPFNHSGNDPSYRNMQGLYCAFNDYLHNELETIRPFEQYTPFAPVILYWNFGTYDSIDWPDLVQRVNRTLVYNPKMKIFVGSGYYDCRTPFAATEYSFDHLNLPQTYQGNFQFEYYQAGHGFIFDHPSLVKLKSDLVRFYER